MRFAVSWRSRRRAGVALGVGLGLVAFLAFVASPAAHGLAGRWERAGSTHAASPRLRVTLNDGWRYAPGPIEGAELPAHDDSSWERVDLPHTWNAADVRRGDGRYRRGPGWYRKWLPEAPHLAGKRLFLRFEGANQVADVFVDGDHLGRHVGGYTAFTLDATRALDPGGEHLLAVRVDNDHDPDIPPLEADFTFYGGIYRDLWLIAVDPVHVDLLDHGSPGVYVDTPDVSRERADVRIRALVVNDSESPRTAEVVHRVLDAAGRERATARREVRLPAGGRASAEDTARLEDPELWSPRRPYLYRLVTDIRAQGVVVDRIENPLGIRRIGVDEEGRFTLNGTPLRLNGTNRHQDREGSGNALDDGHHRRDLEIVDRTGFNFLRLAHYPQDPAVLAAADRLGLLVWEEIPIVNRVTPTRAFAANAERMLVEMIRQHYNHPSVALWGTMNEVFLRPPDPRPEGYEAFAVELARRLDERAHAEDPHRLTALALSRDEIEDDRGLADVPDVLGMNLYFGWYYETFADLGRFLDEQHRRHPSRRLFVSEYGAGSDDRVRAAEPVAFDFSPEYQQRFHAASYPQIVARPWVMGAAVWNQFDFGSAHRQDTRDGINQKGLYDFDRRPKDVAFYYEAMLAERPVLRLAHERDRRAGSRPADRRQVVRAYSNLDTVALAMNGADAGTRPVRDGIVQWTVELADGTNTLTARGLRDGAEMVDVARIDYEDRTSFFRERGDAAGGVAGDAPPASRVAVNAGGHYAYVDGTWLPWEPDREYSEAGGWGFVGGENVRTHGRIHGTEDDALFQAAREGVRAYRFDVPDGAYELTVSMAELVHDEPGARVFGARVGEQWIFRDLDLAARHGPRTAVAIVARVEAVNGRGVPVTFEASRGRTTVSALRLERL